MIRFIYKNREPKLSFIFKAGEGRKRERGGRNFVESDFSPSWIRFRFSERKHQEVVTFFPGKFFEVVK